MRVIQSKFLLVWIVIFFMMPDLANALTLGKAINMARKSLPAYRAAMMKARSTGVLATSSLGPYLPSLDANGSYDRHYNLFPDYNTQVYQFDLTYSLFDGGKRHANRNIALLNSDSGNENLRKTLIDLEYNVKIAFYSLLARKDSLESKKLQLDDAQRDYDIAQGRYKFGLAKLSDMLQASVRLEQAKYNVITARGELRQAFADLDSLIGLPLETKPPLEGSLDFTPVIPVIESLRDAVLRKPEIEQAADTAKIAHFNRSLELSAFWPTISADASYVKSIGAAPGTVLIPEDRFIGVSAKWNVLEFGKFFRQKAAAIAAAASEATLDDTKRQLLLDLQKTYDNYLTSIEDLTVAKNQLHNAEHNYALAFGEYKIGEADILSLVQAETLLADARDQMINTKLNLLVNKSQLERVAGIPKLESLPTAAIYLPHPVGMHDSN